MEVTIAHNQGLDIDADFIDLLNADFARMTIKANLITRYQVASNDTSGLDIWRERLVTEKQSICEILSCITLFEKDLTTGQLKREDKEAHGM